MELGVKTSVYVIEEKGRRCVKVGSAANPNKRLGLLQVGNSAPLVLVFQRRFLSRTVAQQVEFFSHQKLRPFHIRGEWFFCSRALAIEAVETAGKFVLDRHALLEYGTPEKRLRSMGVFG